MAFSKTIPADSVKIPAVTNGNNTPTVNIRTWNRERNIIDSSDVYQNNSPEKNDL